MRRILRTAAWGVALLLTACATGRPAAADLEAAREVAVLETPSRVGVIAEHDMLVQDDSLSRIATANLAAALYASVQVTVDTLLQVAPFTALEDSLRLLAAREGDVPRRRLSAVPVPESLLSFGRETGNRFVLVTLHEGFFRTRENYRKEALKGMALTLTTILADVLTGGVLIGATAYAPSRNVSALSVALVDTQEAQVLYFRGRQHEMPPFEPGTAVWQLGQVLGGYYGR